MRFTKSRFLKVFLIVLAVASSAFGQSYTISTFAGGGLPVNIPGTSASLLRNGVGEGPQGTAVDQKGNVFFTDQNIVLRLDATTGVLSLVAGNGIAGYSGDGGPAANAEFNGATGVALDSAANVYFADTGNNRIREVSNGLITTVAGNGTAGFSGDGGPAINAELSAPMGVALDSAGNLYIADSGNQRIRKVSNGVITTVAGNGTLVSNNGPGTGGYSGDGGPAISAELNNPTGIALDSAANLYIADTLNQRIREVSSGVINTVAGNGTAGFSGDGGPATSAQLKGPVGVAVDSAGNIYIADSGNERIRKVSNGVITTVAGDGMQASAATTARPAAPPYRLGAVPASR
jgi:sugar lactone lactonase YvrE